MATLVWLLLGFAGGAATAARAQSVSSIEVRRLVEAWQAGDLDRVLELARQLPLSDLSQPDRAVAAFYEAAALFAREDRSQGAAVLRRAVMADPSVRPDTSVFNSEVQWAYAAARAEVPILLDLSVGQGDFRPLLGESGSITHQFEPGSRMPARVRLMLRSPSAEIELWSGTEGERAVWNGRGAGGSGDYVPTGDYDLVLLATAQNVPEPQEWRLPVHVAFDAPNGLMPPQPPYAPGLEDTTHVVTSTNRGAKRGWLRSGLLLTVLGAGAATYASLSAPKVVRESAPGSGQRKLVFNVWIGGSALGGIGGIVTLRGLFGRFLRPETVLDMAAIERNATRMQQHASAVAEQERQVELIRSSVVVRIAPAAASAGR